MSPTPHGATIRHLTEVQSIDNMGRPQNHVRIEYMVGTHGPFYELIPKSEFTAQNVVQKLDTFAQQINQLHR